MALLDCNILRINLGKSKILNFQIPRSNYLPIKILHTNQMLELVFYKIKLFCVIFDEYFTQQNYTEEICMKINRFIFALQVVSNESVYHSLPRS